MPLGKLLQQRGRGSSPYFATLDSSQSLHGHRTAEHGTGPPSSVAVSDASLPQSYRDALDQFEAQYDQPENEEFPAANSVSKWAVNENDFKDNQYITQYR